MVLQLDLFASIEKFNDGSARVQMFSRFLNGAFSLHQQLQRRMMRSSRNHSSAAGSDEYITNAVYEELLQQESVLANMSEQERLNEELRDRLAHEAGGARSLPQRALEFYINFLHVAKKRGTGPFQTVSDNQDGICYVDLHSMIDIVQRVFVKCSSRVLDECIHKMNERAQRRPGFNSQLGLQSVLSNDADRFVDFDVMMLIIMEGYLEEEARLSNVLHETFIEAAVPGKQYALFA